MADNNVTNLQSRQFGFDQVRGVITATLYANDAIVHEGNTWKLDLDQEIQGFDLNRTYNSVDELVTTFMGFLINNNAYQGVITKMAA